MLAPIASGCEVVDRIADPNRVMAAYLHELSGDMNRHVLIAITIVGRPALVVLDEPTTALDVTVQLETTMLVRDLRDRLGISMLFITHDFGLAADLADRLHVLYAGRVVEEAAVLAGSPRRSRSLPAETLRGTLPAPDERRRASARCRRAGRGVAAETGRGG